MKRFIPVIVAAATLVAPPAFARGLIVKANVPVKINANVGALLSPLLKTNVKAKVRANVKLGLGGLLRGGHSCGCY